MSGAIPLLPLDAFTPWTGTILFTFRKLLLNACIMWINIMLEKLNRKSKPLEILKSP